MPDLPELGFLAHSASLPWLLGAAVLLSLGAILVLAGLTARILKWHALANLLGLSTAYELDRVGGRFRAIEQERAAPRTLHPLGQQKPLDLFDLRKRYAFLAPFFDAEYGSAAFVPVNEPAE